MAARSAVPHVLSLDPNYRLLDLRYGMAETLKVRLHIPMRGNPGGRCRRCSAGHHHRTGGVATSRRSDAAPPFSLSRSVGGPSVTPLPGIGAPFWRKGAIAAAILLYGLSGVARAQLSSAQAALFQNAIGPRVEALIWEETLGCPTVNSLD